jgi:hypothetical protein
MRLYRIIKDKRGQSTPLTIALVLSLLIVCCAIAEFCRLGIIVGGVRDGLQSAVISVSTTNYDETYNGLREGYSGGYILDGNSWEEALDYGDVYGQLDRVLGTSQRGGYHVKAQAEGWEYRLSGLEIDIINAPLAPGNANQNFEADVRIQLEVPLSFGWELLPPLTMEVRTRAAYMPKF